jgi:hypothetical protein
MLPQINTFLILMQSVLKNNKVHLRLHHIRHRQPVPPFVFRNENNPMSEEDKNRPAYYLPKKDYKTNQSKATF